MNNYLFNPFLYYSNQLQSLLLKASKQKNPALWLYKNDARTVLFMLESLTRLYSKAFGDQAFIKWNKFFKKLEDIFGLIDDYLCLEMEFKSNKNISKKIVKYFAVLKNTNIEKCNQRLQEKYWFNFKLNEFDESIKKNRFEYNEEHIAKLKSVIRDEIDSILNFAIKYNYCFTKLEAQVHEMRRKLRWLSIYAHALLGLIQLKKTVQKQKTEINYFTKKVIASSYNKLPVKPKNASIIEFDNNAFLALSWLINALGILKDNGLKIEHLRDAIFITEDISQLQAKEKAIVILGLKQTAGVDILIEASSIIKIALSKDKILNKMVI